MPGINDCVDVSLRVILQYTVVLFAALGAGSCTGDKQSAQGYYDSFSDIIIPYKEGTENILTEIQSMLHKQMTATGSFKLSQQDSLRQDRLIRDFENLSHATADKLKALHELPESELRSAGVRYVELTSLSVLGAYREIALPLQNTERSPDQNTIDSLGEMYSDQLLRANEDFASHQLEFLRKFDLLSL